MAIETTSKLSRLSARLAPARELRLLIDGLKRWAESIAAGGLRAPSVGLLQGRPAQGTGFLVRSLGEVCPQLGLRYLRAPFLGPFSGPGGALVDVLEQILESDSRAGRGAGAGQHYAAELAVLLPERFDAGTEDASTGVPGGVTVDRCRLMEAVVRTLLDWTRERPSVLVFENLEHADPLSSDIVAHLLRALRSGRPGEEERTLVILTADRPRSLDLDRLTRDRQLAFAIDVRGYSRGDIEEIARRELGASLPVSVRETIHRVTGGDVWPVLWLLRRMTREGTGELDPTVVTEDVAPLLAGAFAELGERARDVVLRLAAARTSLRRSSLDRWLAPAAGSGGIGAPARGPAGDLAGLLEALEEAGWIERSGVEEHEPSWRFHVEPWIRDAILSAESAPAVAALSGEMADLLVEESGARGRGAVRAFLHSLERWNGELGLAGRRRRPASAERLWDLARAALDYAEGVACPESALEILEGALALHERIAPGDIETRKAHEEGVARLLEETANHREAIEVWSRLLSRAGPVETQVGFWRRIGDLRGALGERPAQEEAYSRALQLASDLPVTRERPMVLERLARLRLERGDFDGCAAICEEGRRALANLQDGAAGGGCDFDRVEEESAFRRHDWARALEIEERIAARCEESGDLRALIESLGRLAGLLARTGETGRAETCARRAVHLARDSGLLPEAATALARLGALLGDRRQFQEAFEALAGARDVFEAFGMEGRLAKVEAVLLVYELRLGRFDAAGAVLARLIERRFGCVSGWPLEPRGSDDDLRDGARRWRADAARRREALERDAPGEEDRLDPPARLELAELWTQDGRVQDAFRMLELALGRDDFKADPEVRARAVEALGRLALLRGQIELALTSCEQSLKALALSRNAERVANVCLELGRILLVRGHVSRAVEYTLRGLALALETDSGRLIVEAMLSLGALLIDAGAFRAGTVIAGCAATVAPSWALYDLVLRASTLAFSGAAAMGAEGAADRARLRAGGLDAVLEIPLERCRLLLEVGWDCFRKRQFARAAEHARAGLDQARHVGFELLLPELRHLLGSVDGAVENPHKNLLRSLEVLERVLREAEVQRRPHLAWEASQTLARIYASRGKSEPAGEYARRAAESAALALAALPPEWQRVSWRSRCSRHRESPPEAPPRPGYLP